MQSRADNRANFPLTAAAVDEIRELFGEDVKLMWAIEGDKELGNVPKGVRETSRIAYHEYKGEGKLNRDQKKIVEFMKQFPKNDFSLQEIAKYTQLPINVVSGRCFELKNDLKEVIECNKRKCSITKKLITPLRLAA